MKARTCFAPSRSVYPQSPSPTMVSYSVIVGSSLMTALQPAWMRARIEASLNLIWALDGERVLEREEPLFVEVAVVSA
jgi:hypothetical protein